MASAAIAIHDTSWVTELPELDDLQVGSIRRIANLSRQLPGDWSGMMGRDIVLSEDFSALRFQLSYMIYALGLAHVHRLPAAPAVFQKPFENLIRKLLHPDVWHYWSNASTGMGPLNKDLGPRERLWDPVAEDNIMYSAYLQSSALMYHYIFRDDKFAQPGALRFRLNTSFWHEGGYDFKYDEKSLTSLIYWQMAEQGFLGVACEPGLIFQICNQPTLIGLRLHDLVYGGNMASDAEKGYVAAWKEFGMLDDSGGFKTFIARNTNTPVTMDTPQMNFWLMSLLHSWYPDIVEKQYPILMDRYLLDGPDGTKWIKPIQHLPDEEGEEFLLPPNDIAWAACAATEVGDHKTSAAILAYADRFLNPAWQDGGYYYKRRDANFDADGYFIGMDAAAGNALLHYARLNVKDGLKKLYAEPLDDSHFTQPALIAMPDELDVYRAIFEIERNALVLTLGALPTAPTITLGIRAPRGEKLPVIIQDGEEIRCDMERTDTGFTMSIDLRDRTTLVIQW